MNVLSTGARVWMKHAKGTRHDHLKKKEKKGREGQETEDDGFAGAKQTEQG